MASLGAITSTITTAAGALAGLILVSPERTIGYAPESEVANLRGSSEFPPSLLFNYEGEQSVSLQSDITDHYIEDNTAIQDQIAIRPDEITTNGFIGELNDIPPNLPAFKIAQVIASKLTTISGYLPEISTTALLAYNESVFLYNTAQALKNSSVAAWSSLSGTGGESVIDGNSLILQPNQNKQQIAFQQFYGYYKSRVLFTVQTPWAVFTTMAIKSIRAIQDAETRMISSFEITFKKIQIANTQVVTNLTTGVQQGRAATQSAFRVDLGTSVPSLSLITLAGAVGGII